MHYSKTYASLLLTLPPELRDNAIQYRELKKLIRDVVQELEAIGLSPEILQKLLQQKQQPSTDSGFVAQQDSFPKVVYEFSTSESEDGQIEPRLRFCIHRDAVPSHRPTPSSPPRESSPSSSGHNSVHHRQRASISELNEHGDEVEDSHDGEEKDDASWHGSGTGVGGERQKGLGWGEESLLYALQRHGGTSASNGRGGNDERASVLATPDPLTDGSEELIVPLVNDTAFYRLLSTALQSIATHLLTVQQNFTSTLEDLSRSISFSARPSHSTSSFHAYSRSTDPALVRSSSGGSLFTSKAKSDLYAWRAIFELYVEAEVFEDLSESKRGERSVKDSEGRLAQFVQRVTERGLGDGRTLKLRESREALKRFLEVNLLLLDLKKFQHANTEATRKILKKHAKRTALPIPFISLSSTLSPSRTSLPSSSALIPTSTSTLPSIPLGPDGLHDSMTLTVPGTIFTLPRALVQAISETLLPVIPHVDDYSCLICTSIAFKPIRLFCGHLFCVRCLVKMQKRGKGNCPLCRAPTVLQADRSNVDWALLNFMQDWFPEEAKEKMKQNEQESAEEMMRELGWEGRECVIM